MKHLPDFKSYNSTLVVSCLLGVRLGQLVSPEGKLLVSRVLLKPALADVDSLAEQHGSLIQVLLLLLSEEKEKRTMVARWRPIAKNKCCEDPDAII